MSESRPSRRPRISLLSAFLLVALIASSTVIVELWREVEPLQRRYAHETRKTSLLSHELRQLREAIGGIHIVDPSVTQVYRAPTNSQSEWGFVMHVPEGAGYRVLYHDRRVPSRGLPSGRSSLGELRPGRRWVSYWAQRDDITGAGSAQFTIDANRPIELDAGWIDRIGDAGTWPWGSACDINRSTRTYAPSEPIVLVRHRMGSEDDARRVADGFMLWLEPLH